MVFRYLSEAFDVVNHRRPLVKLIVLHIPCNLLMGSILLGKRLRKSSN